MPLNPAWEGKAFPPSEPYEISREKIREFASAIGDFNPAYHDVEAARALGHPDLIAPPTFAIIVTLRRGGSSILDPDLGLNYAMVVHGEQGFSYSRPLYAGDVVTATSRIASIRTAGSNELLTLEIEMHTTAGELVCTATNTIVSRGTAVTS
jgi:acyl dehydratase